MIGTRRSELIQNVINTFARENKSLLKLLNEIQYWYRGAMSRDDVFAMSPAEREIACEVLDKRFKEAPEYWKKGLQIFL